MILACLLNKRAVFKIIWNSKRINIHSVILEHTTYLYIHTHWQLLMQTDTTFGLNVQVPTHIIRHLFKGNFSEARLLLFVGTVMIERQNERIQNKLIPFLSLPPAFKNAGSHLKLTNLSMSALLQYCARMVWGCVPGPPPCCSQHLSVTCPYMAVPEKNSIAPRRCGKELVLEWIRSKSNRQNSAVAKYCIC